MCITLYFSIHNHQKNNYIKLYIKIKDIII